MKIPLRVKIGLWLLKRNCDKHSCWNCVFGSKKIKNDSSCMMTHNNPWVTWNNMKKKGNKK